MEITSSFKGMLSGFPAPVVERMLHYQGVQGNKIDAQVFEKNRGAAQIEGGFKWGETYEGRDFWYAVIAEKRFDIFFKKYPYANEDCEPMLRYMPVELLTIIQSEMVKEKDNPILDDYINAGELSLDLLFIWKNNEWGWDFWNDLRQTRDLNVYYNLPREGGVKICPETYPVENDNLPSFEQFVYKIFLPESVLWILKKWEPALMEYKGAVQCWKKHCELEPGDFVISFRPDDACPGIIYCKENGETDAFRIPLWLWKIVAGVDIVRTEHLSKGRHYDTTGSSICSGSGVIEGLQGMEINKKDAMEILDGDKIISGLGPNPRYSFEFEITPTSKYASRLPMPENPGLLSSNKRR